MHRHSQGDLASLMFLIQLRKNCVHDLDGQKNFAIRNWFSSAFQDGPVERFDQVFHTRLHMEVSGQKSSQIRAEISEVLLGQANRRDKFLSVADISLPAKPDEGLLILIQNQAILLPIDAELMESRSHLRRKSKIGGGAFFVTDDHSQLIDDFAFAPALKSRTGEPKSDHLRRVTGQELRNSGDAMADNIVQQLSGKPANPVVFVTQKRLRVAGS